MTRILTCIAWEHDLRMLPLALLVCILGSAATAQLFSRIRATSGPGRLGWTVLTALATGSMVWSTHFVAMLAFDAKAPVSLDPLLTFASLQIAVVVAAPGLLLAAACGARVLAAAGGSIVGLSIAAMHYAGMMAYRVDGLIRWDPALVALSVLLSVALAAAAFDRLTHGRSRRDFVGASALLSASVVTLHFTGMSAITVIPSGVAEGGLSPEAIVTMAITTTLAALLVISCAAVSALLDAKSESDAFRRLRRMALRDPLTDLPNRLSLNEHLRRRLAGQAAGGPGLALALMDLSGFKRINDRYGHQAGDQLLVALAARFAALLRPGERIARLGGDEFAAVIPATTADDLDDFFSRLADAFERPFVFDRFSATLGASVGISIAPVDGTDSETLLGKADLAMYRAKEARSDEPCFYQPEMDDAARDRRALATELRAALDREQFELFELFYQVQVCSKFGRIDGFEALLRWRHPERGMISPATFIPIAEEMGLILPLGNWTIRRACEEAVGWSEPHRVAVNLSPLQLADQSLVKVVEEALAATGLPASRLELELTESMLIRDRALALHQLRCLRDMGVLLALDDFGVGYSSMDVLRAFPFDRIKLDASFVAEIENDPQAVAMLGLVASLGRTLGVPVLAEGVETRDQLGTVAEQGCSVVQGFLLGRPARELVTVDEVRARFLGCSAATMSTTAVA